MFYFVLIVFCLIFIFLRILFYWKMGNIIRKTKSIPGIQSYPLIGSGHLVIGKTNEEIFHFVRDTFKLAWDNPIKIWMGPIFFIVVSNTDDIQAVTNSPNCVDKHYVYDFFENQGLFSASGKIWKHDRKILNPTFNIKILNSFIPIFMSSSKLMIKSMEKELGQGEFEVTDYLFAYTLETICRTAMGYNIEVLSNKNGDFVDGVKGKFKMVAERIVRFWLHPNIIYHQTTKHKEDLHYTEMFSRISQKVIDEKFSDENILKTCKQEEDYKTPQLFIDQLLSLRSETNFTKAQIKDHIDTMILAATETTTVTVSYILLMLANYPDIQERVFQEVEENYTEDIWDATNVSKLVYMEMVIKETMRLYPVGPFIARVTKDKVGLRNYTLPAGIFILISYYHLHRDPKVWGSNAEMFNPDNFLPENMNKRNPNSFGAFSLGLRNCIGWKYAMLSMKTVIAEFLMKYKVFTSVKPEKFRHTFEVSLKLLNGFYISIERRNKIKI